jgi:hypothetical protein
VHLAIAFELGTNPRSADDYRAAFSSIAKQATSQHKRAADDIEATIAEANELKGQFAVRLRTAAVKMARRHHRQLASIRSSFSTAERDIRAVEAAYTLQMGLQAPVDYWKKKHKRHQRDAITYRTNLLIFSVVGSGGVAFALWAIATKIHEASAQNAGAGALAYGALGLLMTTVALWAGRILVRLYMSEHHLALDAEERATMIETYLALQLKQQVDQKDLLVVLTGMFRPTADGIVKDDAAPELGAAGLLSKLLNAK